MQEKTTYEGWAIIELFGHNMIAGFISEQVIGGAPFVRVDVPKTADQEAYTKFYGGAAIYGITPTTEDTVRTAVAQLQPRPVATWVVPTQRQLSSQRDFFEEDDSFDEEDEKIFPN
jgi:hypothetical protein